MIYRRTSIIRLSVIWIQYLYPNTRYNGQSVLECTSSDGAYLCLAWTDSLPRRPWAAVDWGAGDALPVSLLGNAVSTYLWHAIWCSGFLWVDQLLSSRPTSASNVYPVNAAGVKPEAAKNGRNSHVHLDLTANCSGRTKIYHEQGSEPWKDRLKQ